MVFFGDPGGPAKKIGRLVDFETAGGLTGTDPNMTDFAADPTCAFIAGPMQPWSDPPSAVRRCDAEASGERAEGEEGFREDAFHAFVREQHRGVARWARAHGVPEALAADILQSSLLRLWEMRGTVGRSGWEPWIGKAMILRLLHHLRSARRARVYETALAYLTEVQQERPTPERATELGEDLRELLCLVDGLAPDRREVVRHYLIDDMPMDEVAARLGISYETAKTRWHLAQEDMAAAWKRDRAKERFQRSWELFVAAVVALFFALRRRAAGEGEGDSGALSGRGPDPREGASRRRKDSGVGRLLACAALPLVVVSHRAMEPATVDEGAREEAVASSFDQIGAFSPILTTNAEREREWGARASTHEAPRGAAISTAATARDGLPPTARSRDAVYPAATSTAAPPRAGTADRDRLVGPRALLTRASAALQEGHVAVARDALRLYELTWPDDPFPAQHAQLAAAVRSP